VSGGYAQGVARAIGSRASVLIAGAEAPIVGRVAMDVCVVDIGDLDVAVRDEALFFGADRPDLLRAWAGATGWAELELAAVVGLCVPREEAA
ncbi:MAG: alanine racemase C-terminal domain-containing protein, partial [Candidatus Microbacterium stercoravium]